MAAGKRALEQIAADHSWFVYVSENGAIFNPATLQKFDSIVFNNTSGPLFTATQQQAFEEFVDADGDVHYLRNQEDDEGFRKQLAQQIRSAAIVPRISYDGH